jgi:hypothetical protein
MGTTREQAKIGTKQKFGSWLNEKRGITYTKYTTLTPEAKKEIQKEYKGAKKAA